MRREGIVLSHAKRAGVGKSSMIGKVCGRCWWWRVNQCESLEVGHEGRWVEGRIIPMLAKSSRMRVCLSPVESMTSVDGLNPPRKCREAR